MLLHVVAGRHAIEALEDGGEGGGVREAAGIHHLGDVHALVSQQAGCFLQADVTDEVVRCLSCQFLHLPMQVNAADAHLVGYHIDTEVGVVQILIDAVHDTVEEFLVGRLDTDLVDLFLEFVIALILQAQQSVAADKI